MTEVVGVVHVHAADGRAEELLAAFERAVTATHAEEGCLTYALHRDAADPLHFVLVERWRSQADLAAHMTTDHVAALFTAVGAPGLLTEPPSLTFASALGLGDPAKASLG